MSVHFSADAFSTVADRVDLAQHAVQVDRNFGLPSELYVATFGLYFAFLSVMTLGFGSKLLAIPMAICAIFLMMAFSVPRLWATMRPLNPTKPLDWMEYQRAGIETYTGTVKARDANAQVLILPILILLWATATVIIASIV